MAASLATARRMGNKNLVGFEVDQIAYAADIHRVREIIRPLPLIPLPLMPDGVVGVADHRGHVMPVVDVRRRFDLKGAGFGGNSRWVIVGRGERLVGLVVDRVSEVFGVEGAQERAVPELGKSQGLRGITTAYVHQGALVFIVDLDRLTDVTEELDMSVVSEMVEQRRQDSVR